MQFGSNIYPETREKLLACARVLESHGYFESKRKPNLFYKTDQEEGIVYFADMRGTDMVPIWSEPYPLFYVKFTKELPRWKRNRLAGKEFRELAICRESYDLDLDEYNTQGDDGFCVVCGKDFQDDGSCCSPECKEAWGSMWQPYCRVCGKKLKDDEIIEHHLSYGENKTITVCRSCHLKIHRGSKLPKLRPVDNKKRTVI